MELPDAKYGEAADYADIQSGAPLASAQPITSGGGAPGGLDLSQIIGLGEDSTNPDEPVTSGAAAGPGPGPDALGLPRSADQEDARALAQAGYLQAMIRVADSDAATPSFKRLVRQVIANL